MLKFIRGKGNQPSAERLKLQRELFAFRKTVQHGFPNKPTAIAWDAELRLLCIGTASGALKVFGRPGVEFYGQHAPVGGGNISNGPSGAPPAVIKLVFLPGAQGRLVSLCNDNSLHLWEINKSSIVEVKLLSLEGKLKKISTICVESGGGNLLLGTEGGNIYLLDLATFTMASDIIYQDVVMQNVPEDYKINPGAVECIAEQPGRPDHILIGYAKGLMVLWSRGDTTALQTFISTQQLESICWHSDAQHFTSSHNDGSYAIWDVTTGEKPCGEPVTTYGPFPCKAINKIEVKTLRGNSLLVFSGGTPRASCSDKYTVSVINGDKHVVFDFTSKVIDFFTITPLYGSEEPDTLIVLAEEELIAIDLIDSSWRMLSPPYLVSLHASAVTCSAYVGPVPDGTWRAIKDAGRNAKSQRVYSDREWPINGGFIHETQSEDKRELLLTGHEDGTIRFWDASGVALTPLYKYSTANLFSGDEIASDDGTENDGDGDDEDWPPLRKTGVFDPYSDDPRLAIKKVTMCPVSGTIVAAGTAGHIVVAQLVADDHQAKEVQVTTMNIVSDRDGFVWKGHKQLTPRANVIPSKGGFQALNILQLHPPAAITCISLHSEWKLISAGTAHGLALYDFARNKPVLVKCTLNPNDLSGQGDTPISRRKSFKKSLRESFRRLRKGRSTRRAGGTVASPTTATSPRKLAPQSPDSGGDTFNPLDAKPVERQVEARPVDDSLGSMVRCLYFAKTFIISEQNTTATLWAGTNNGTVYVFTINVPGGNKRETDDVTCQLGKEIQLKHRAPVIAIAILDGSSKPLPEPLENRKADYSQPHKVIIASEEQFKIFTLPSLRPWRKYRLTAKEGSRLRRMAFAEFSCKLPDSVDETHTETCLLCLTNLGDCLIWSVPDLIKQLNAAAIRREDINGISSLVFTPFGEALYLHSSSELQRITVNANHVTAARCYLKLVRDKQENGDDENETSTEAEDNVEKTEDKDKISSLRTNQQLVNGRGEGAENGDEDAHDTTISSSVGDITIDSVKDHLANSSLGALSNSDNLPEDPVTSTSSTTVITTSTGGTTVISSTSSSTQRTHNVVLKTTTVTSTNSSSAISNNTNAENND
ncbi:lethal(2) giant larvae protein homolog 1 isoform X2 [Chrysoperla carnea]|uniref:lethal(2) giant larvae protein homolog 1 isoform X2 n=1 Tax=Chrysoperla carnea TaxID=189513 RepID=UPI001D090D79|nr:lethal(2) giant larvae protein homolog 1 isoform X2 [Chrysoperla carnea]